MDKCLYAYREEVISLPGSALHKIINAPCTINTQQELPFYALYMRKTITLSLYSALFCSKLSGSQRQPLSLPDPASCGAGDDGQLPLVAAAFLPAAAGTRPSGSGSVHCDGRSTWGRYGPGGGVFPPACDAPFLTGNGDLFPPNGCSGFPPPPPTATDLLRHHAQSLLSIQRQSPCSPPSMTQCLHLHF